MSIESLVLLNVHILLATAAGAVLEYKPRYVLGLGRAVLHLGYRAGRVNTLITQMGGNVLVT